MMAEEYPQIKYVKQTNGGDASAKNHAKNAFLLNPMPKSLIKYLIALIS